jgi:hypothetical protein
MAPDIILKLIPTAAGSSVITNFIHRSGAEVPQQLSFLGILGLVHVALGLPVRFTLKVGVPGPHCEYDEKEK